MNTATTTRKMVACVRSAHVLEWSQIDIESCERDETNNQEEGVLAIKWSKNDM